MMPACQISTHFFRPRFFSRKSGRSKQKIPEPPQTPILMDPRDVGENRGTRFDRQDDRLCAPKHQQKNGRSHTRMEIEEAVALLAGFI